eukprot:s5454_g2.t1
MFASPFYNRTALMGTSWKGGGKNDGFGGRDAGGGGGGKGGLPPAGGEGALAEHLGLSLEAQSSTWTRQRQSLPNPSRRRGLEGGVRAAGSECLPLFHVPASRSLVGWVI